MHMHVQRKEISLNSPALSHFALSLEHKASHWIWNLTGGHSAVAIFLLNAPSTALELEVHAAMLGLLHRSWQLELRSAVA